MTQGQGNSIMRKYDVRLTNLRQYKRINKWILNNYIIDMTAPYFVVSSGRVNVTAAGAKHLQTVIFNRAANTWNAVGMRPGTRLRADLQNNIRDLQARCGFPRVDTSNHHILAGNTINTMLKGALNQHTSHIDVVNRYLNSRRGINGYLLDLVNRREEEQAINQVHSAVFWHEFNLVLGPKEGRNNEPGSLIDYEVLGIQSEAVKREYKQMDTAVKAQDYYTALEIFLKTRKLFNGEWKVASNGRWNLFEGNGPTYPPGTTGFAYDIWPFY